MTKLKSIMLALIFLASASANAGSASVQSVISGTVAAAGSLSAANVDLGVHTPAEFATMLFALPVTIDLTTGANGTLYAGVPGTPFPLNNGNSINVAAGAGTVWATVYQPDGVTVLSPMAGMAITGTGSPDTKQLGIKIQIQNNYVGSINKPLDLTLTY